MTLDHLLIRATTICPLCGAAKDTGLICCWACFRSENMRNGNSTADAKIDYEEARLAARRGPIPPSASRAVLSLRPGWRMTAAEERR